MKRILVTGATGNVGQEVIHYLHEFNSKFEIIVAVRNIQEAKKRFSPYSNLSFRHFDFKYHKTYKDAFTGIDILFLLRPPHISKLNHYGLKVHRFGMVT